MSQISIFALLIALPACASRPKTKSSAGPNPGMFDRDNPNDAPGDLLEGPAGEANSPGLNPPSKSPPKRR